MAILCFFLAIRSLLLAVFEGKRWINLTLAIFFALTGTALTVTAPFKYDPVISMVLAVLIGISLVLRLYGFRSNRKALKTFFFISIMFVSSAIIALSGFTHLTEDKPIATIKLTGKRKKKWVEWQNPDHALKKTCVETCEVTLQTPKGQNIGKYHLYGDLVAIRARVLRFHSLLNFLGIPNVCLIDAVYNGYQTMDRHNSRPHVGFPIPLPINLFSKLWVKVFFMEWNSTWIKSATLESNYFPLFNDQNDPSRATYILTVSNGGLSALPKN